MDNKGLIIFKYSIFCLLIEKFFSSASNVFFYMPTHFYENFKNLKRLEHSVFTSVVMLKNWRWLSLQTFLINSIANPELLIIRRHFVQPQANLYRLDPIQTVHHEKSFSHHQFDHFQIWHLRFKVCNFGYSINLTSKVIPCSWHVSWTSLGSYVHTLIFAAPSVHTHILMIYWISQRSFLPSLSIRLKWFKR